MHENVLRNCSAEEHHRVLQSEEQKNTLLELEKIDPDNHVTFYTSDESVDAARLRESANGCTPEFGGVCGVRQREAWPWRV